MPTKVAEMNAAFCGKVENPVLSTTPSTEPAKYMSKPSKNMPMPTSSMMRRWNGPIGSRSSRLPELTDVMCCLPCDLFYLLALVDRSMFLFEHDPFGKPLHTFPGSCSS